MRVCGGWKMAKKYRRGQGVVEYRRQAALCLSRICRESPLTGRPVFFATLLSLSRPAHWYTRGPPKELAWISSLLLLIFAVGFGFGLRCWPRPVGSDFRLSENGRVGLQSLITYQL